MTLHKARSSTVTRSLRMRDPRDDTPLIVKRTSTRKLRPVVDLFMAKVEKVESGCWLWRGYVNPANGYGQFRLPGESSKPAHRAAWRIFRGEIPEGLQIDHLCWVRNCVNPDHLEPVTPMENLLRSGGRTECPVGHKWTPENTGQGDGFTFCIACREKQK